MARKRRIATCTKRREETTADRETGAQGVREWKRAERERAKVAGGRASSGGRGS